MEKEKFTLFGTEFSKIPCFKKTFTIGISTGILTGLGSFILTSKVKRSTDIAVLSFVVSSLGFWVYCRYNWSKEQFLASQMTAALHEAMINEGSKGTNDA